MSISSFIKRYPAWIYFVLTFTISWGALLVMIGLTGMPTTNEQLDAQLPIAILAMLAGPSLTGLLLTGLMYGKPGFRELCRSFKWRVKLRWYAIALLTGPLVLMAIHLILSLKTSIYLPSLLVSENKTSLLLQGVFAGVVVGIFEELGWTGFAVPRLRLRYSILFTGLIVGVVWGAWHILSNDVWAIGTYTGSLSPMLFMTIRGLGFLIGLLPPFRVLMVWVYDHTGSLLLAMLIESDFNEFGASRN